MLYQHFISVTHLPVKPKKSKHLSMFLNAYDLSIWIVKLFQYSSKRMNEIVECFGDLKDLYHITVGSTAEGLSDGKSDSDAIVLTSKHVILESFEETNECTDPNILVVRIPYEVHPGYSKLQVILIKSVEIATDPTKYLVMKDDKVYLKNSVKELLLFVGIPARTWYRDSSI